MAKAAAPSGEELAAAALASTASPMQLARAIANDKMPQSLKDRGSSAKDAAAAAAHRAGDVLLGPVEGGSSSNGRGSGGGGGSKALKERSMSFGRKRAS